MACDLVQKHLEIWRRSRFEWGKSDCSIVIADYLQDLTGQDCAAMFRGSYSDDWQGATGFNKLVDLFSFCFDGLLTETEQPQRGDVGVMAVGDGEVGAVCLGDSWAIKSKTGLLVSKRAKILKAWTYAAV